MLGIGVEPTHQLVVVLMSIVAEGLVPSSTIIAVAPELDSLKSWPRRIIALKDGASVGFSDTECDCSTTSSGGRPR